MVQIESPTGELSLIGGVLCLDFANTVGDHAGEHPYEMLQSYDDLLAWSRHAGILDDGLTETLHELAEQHPDLAQVVLLQTIELREAIYAVFTAIVAGNRVDWRPLATINQELTRSLTRLQVVPAADHPKGLIHLPDDPAINPNSRPNNQKKAAPAGDSFSPAFRLAWQTSELDLSLPCWPIAYSASQLLASSRLDRVRQCAGDDCGWLFLDTSRNHSRRWCDMADCGNRAKARRHYRRTHAG